MGRGNVKALTTNGGAGTAAVTDGKPGAKAQGAPLVKHICGHVEPLANVRGRPCRACEAAVVQAPALSVQEIELKLRQAEERSAKDELPALYLMLAQYRMSDGAKSQAEDLLRKSLRVSAGARFKDVQAKARVALGDLAFESGDRSTACEHWQIARSLFHELKQRGEHAAVEGRMLKNGCPTDWVLTDF